MRIKISQSFNGENGNELGNVKTQGLEFSEFVIKVIDEIHLKDFEKIATAFRYFDKDGSGEVEAKEWATVL